MAIEESQYKTEQGQCVCDRFDKSSWGISVLQWNLQLHGDNRFVYCSEVVPSLEVEAYIGRG